MHRLAILLLVLVGCAGCLAQIYVVRPDEARTAIFRVALDGKLAGGLAAATYLIFAVAPGSHVLATFTDESYEAMAIEAEPGQNYTEEDLRTWTARRLLIEADEPPVLRVLDILCHNELLLAMDYPRSELCRVPWWKRLLAPFMNLSDEAIRKVGEAEPA